MPPDPYKTLGVPPSASDEELRRAYRRLVQLHHPDHNAGSPESARRFEEVQDAYAQVLRMRKSAPPPPPPRRQRSDPRVDARLAHMEQELRAARLAREQALRDARQAAAAAGEKRRPSDEELGYVTSDDSFSKIFADALDDIAARLKGWRPPSR